MNAASTHPPAVDPATPFPAGRPTPILTLLASCFALVLGLLLGAFPPRAQAAPVQLPDALKQKLALTSVSGQFVIHADRDATSGVARQTLPNETYTMTVGGQPLTLFSLRPTGASNVIEVDPKLLAVTCERVKKAVLENLGMRDQWRGQVHVFVAPKGRRFQGVEILPEKYGDGWGFRMGIAAECDWQRLVRGIVEVILLEITNREARTVIAQAPLWLSEGIAGLVIAEHDRSLVTEPNAYLVVAGRKSERLRQARTVYRDAEPPTFTDLGQPDVQKLADPDAWSRYQAAAQLFTHELLSDGDGRAQTAAFLRILPYHLNWQVAFLRAFNPRFLTLLDVERWWAVAAADFQSRDPLLQWSREKILRQLALVMRENVEVRQGTNGPVTREEVSLSQLVSRWDFATQRPVLMRKASQVQALHLHSPKELRPLVADLYRTIDTYLYQCATSGYDGDTRGDVPSRIRQLSRDASRRLAGLEDRIGAMLPARQ